MTLADSLVGDLLVTQSLKFSSRAPRHNSRSESC